MKRGRGHGVNDAQAKRSLYVGVGLLICLSFLFSSTGYFAWLNNLMTLADPAWVEALLLVGAYLAQAVGVGIYMLAMRGRQGAQARALAFVALGLQLVTLIPAAILGNLPVVVAFGLVTNVLYGIIQGYYLIALCMLVERGRRGVVFGCAYGASTLLTWLLSLVGGGALVAGVPSVVCCVVMSAVVAVLMLRLPEACVNQAGAGGAQVDGGTGTLAIVCAAIVLVCLVKNACFGFPLADLETGFSLELSRVLYGAGLVLIGALSDYDRRLGLAACAISLVMPFCMLALSGVGAPAVVLWLLGYLLTSIYALFSVLLAADYAEDVKRPHLACLGILLRHVGLAAGSALSIALAAQPQALIAVTAVLLIATAVIIILLDQRLFAQKPKAGESALPAEPAELSEQRHLERFSAAYGLSAREREVLPLLIAGKTNAEIAAELFVTERTVKFHVHNIMEKTGCANRLAVTDLYNAGAEG